MVQFCVYISPIFSCPVTIIENNHYRYEVQVVIVNYPPLWLLIFQSSAKLTSLENLLRIIKSDCGASKLGATWDCTLDHGCVHCVS